MIPFDMTVSIVTGQTLALAARRQLSREKDFLVNKPLMISLLWQTLLYTPSAMFFYHGWTAWNSVYILRNLPGVSSFPEYPYFESQRLLFESILIWLDCTLLVGLFYVSFVLAHRWIAAGKAKNIAVACTALTLVFLAYAALTYDRSFVVSTYEHWEQLKVKGISFPDVFSWRGLDGNVFLGHSVFWANVIVAFIDFGPLVYLYRKFSKEM